MGKNADDTRPIFYDRYVSAFKTSGRNRDERWLRSYWSWCRHKYLPVLEPIGRGHRILELGCGPGYLLEFLKAEGFEHVEGIDIAKEQVRIAQAQGLKAVVADCFKFLQGNKGRYGAIVAVDFIEHFTKKELLKLFTLIRQALSSNGLLLVQTPNGQGLFPGQVIYGDLTHQTIFAQDSLRHILTLNGFVDIGFAETGPAPDDLEGRLRTVLWKIIRAAIRIVRQIEAKNSSKLWTESFICWCRKGTDILSQRKARC
jgi:2-polyprenyl-3-methyl-5-hydroxy-6-metoxy-1,4-benzoquinol methylase